LAVKTATHILPSWYSGLRS